MNDVIDENGSEPVTVGLGTLNASSGASLGGGASGSGSASFNITDDDSAPGGISLSVDTDSDTSGSQTSLAENAGKTSVTVTASVTGGTAYEDDKTVEIDVGADGSTATEGEDYATVGALTLTIPAGATTREMSFDLTPTNDDVDENDEIIRIAGESGDLSVGNASITLNDNDERGVSVSSSSLTIEEVDDGSTPGSEEHKATYTVGLDSQPTGNVRVTLTVPNGAPFTASPTQLDFTASSWGAQTVTVTAVNDNNSNAGGKRSATITHTLTASDTDYDDETVGSVAVTVNDEDDAPMSATLSVDADADSNGTQTDLAEGGGAKKVRVTATFGGSTRFDTAQTIAVTVGASTDSATKDTDYSSSANIVNITIAAEGATGYEDVTLTPTNDDIDEADESISLSGTLSGVTVSGVSIGLIDDDERGATLSGTSLTVNEADTAATTDTKENEATYTLALNSQPTAAVRVNLSLPDGAPVTISPTHLDFTTSSWGAKTVTVTALDDAIDNPNNRRDTTITHTLVVGSSDYGTVQVPNVGVRVNDDDAAPGGIALSADIATIAENAATRNVMVTATVGGGTTYSEAKTVEVEVGGSDDSATDGTDYAEVEKFSITINAGAATGQKSFSLNPTDDVIDEPNETIGITGTTTGIDVDGASISITDNDAAPTGVMLSVNPASVAEDAAATSVTVTATVTGGTTYAEAKTVSVTVGDSNDSATDGTDYKSVDDFDLSIAAGTASAQKAFSLAPTNDERDEANERISVTGTATGITFVDTHIDLIDDEGPPTLSIDAPTVAEGADGTTARLRFKVQLSAASDKQVTVDYADRLTGTAGSATDYAALTAATLTFAAGDTVKHIDVTVNGDDVDESNETVILRLSSPSNAGFAGNVTTVDASGTITDDDTRGLSVSPTTLDIDERDDTSTASKKEHQGTYAVVLTSEPTGGTVTVNVASGATGTATVSPQSLTFNASNWETAQNVTVTAVDDAFDNTDDARKAIITNTVSAAGTDYSDETASSVTVTVNDDDTAPMDVALSVDTTTLAEDAGATSITVTATLKGDARFAADKTVRITVGEDTDAAVSGSDYKGVQAFDLTITAGQASGQKSFTLEPTEDVIDEPSEQLRVTGKLAGLTVAPASISITDNDAAPTGIALSVNTTSLSESAAATSVTVTADVQGGTTYGAVTAVSVIVGAAADTAGEGADYARVDEFTIDIPVGAASASKSFDLAPVNDIIDEPTETLSVSGKSGDLTVTGAGNIDITDDDATPTASLVLSKTTINEDGGSANLSATISGPSSQALTLTVSVAVDSPMTTNDFTIAANPELIIPAGETSSSAKVAVSAVDNDEDHAVDNKQLRLSATASGGLGIADPGEVTLTIKDDDKAGVNFSTSEIEVEKDETTVIQVRLTSQPTMDTTVILTSNNPSVAELSASPRGRSVELLFTPENWNVPQQVTVHGMDDGEVSIDTSIQSADPMYAKAEAPKPLPTNVIGVPNLTLTASEDHIGEGEAATFTIEADRVSAVDVPVKIEVGYLDCCIGTGEILAEGEQGVRTVTLPQGQTSVSFKVRTADDDEIHGEDTRRGNKSIFAQIVETDAYRIDHTANDELMRFTYYDSVMVGENDLEPEPPADIVVSVTGPERVMEGDTAEFTFTASKAPESDLVISFYLDSSGDFDTSPSYAFDPEVMSGLEKETVTLPAGALQTTFSLTINDDADIQGHGRLNVRVSNGRNNAYDSADPPGLQVLVDIIDDETSPPGGSQQPDSDEPESQQPDSQSIEGTDTACVPADLLDYVDERIAIATTDRWERIKNALTEQPNAIGLAEVREIYENRKANGWTINRLDEVIEALECLESGTSAQQTASQDAPPAAAPAVSIEGGADITEGGDAAFTIELDTALETALTVQLEVADDRDADFLASAEEGTRTVTIPAGKTSASFTVATVDDEVDESDGYVRVSVVADAAYDAKRGDDEYDEVRVRDNDTSISLSVDDVEIREALGAKLVFTVSLSEEAYEEVWVNFDSRDVEAKAGEDYARVSGTLIFPPFETERQVEVLVYDDEHDEGAETMELVLSGGSGAKLGKAVGVGTINNTDPMPKAWLARFGRGMAEQVVDGLSMRWDTPRTPGMTGRIGGMSIGSGGMGVPSMSMQSSMPGAGGQFQPMVSAGPQFVGSSMHSPLQGGSSFMPGMGQTGAAGAMGFTPMAPTGLGTRMGAGMGMTGVSGGFGMGASQSSFPGGMGMGAGFPQSPASQYPAATQFPTGPGMSSPGGAGAMGDSMYGGPASSGGMGMTGYDQDDRMRAFLRGSSFTVTGVMGGDGELQAPAQLPEADAQPASGFSLISASPAEGKQDGNPAPETQGDDADAPTVSDWLHRLPEVSPEPPPPPEASWSLWGGLNESQFRGDDGELGVEGNLLSGMFGGDIARDNWLAGVALNYTEGQGGYRPAGQGGNTADGDLSSSAGGEIRTRLAAVTPYGKLQLAEGREVWGTFGLGAGTMQLAPSGQRRAHRGRYRLADAGRRRRAGLAHGAKTRRAAAFRQNRCAVGAHHLRQDLRADCHQRRCQPRPAWRRRRLELLPRRTRRLAAHTRSRHPPRRRRRRHRFWRGTRRRHRLAGAGAWPGLHAPWPRPRQPRERRLRRLELRRFTHLGPGYFLRKGPAAITRPGPRRRRRRRSREQYVQQPANDAAEQFRLRHADDGRTLDRRSRIRHRPARQVPRQPPPRLQPGRRGAGIQLRLAPQVPLRGTRPVTRTHPDSQPDYFGIGGGSRQPVEPRRLAEYGRHAAGGKLAAFGTLARRKPAAARRSAGAAGRNRPGPPAPRRPVRLAPEQGPRRPVRSLPPAPRRTGRFRRLQPRPPIRRQPHHRLVEPQSFNPADPEYASDTPSD